ncbi:hypothetical protein GCM10010353_18140 [Streptomyces chryseus]|nr:hypothetical protein GCM10010353_18140 [Streptomyces chryseus]
MGHAARGVPGPHGESHRALRRVTRVLLLGEQPGDQEDRQGRPFVGPAGKVLTRALDEAGIDPDDTYVTNAVKHFKFEGVPERGKRRIHKAPTCARRPPASRGSTPNRA